LSDDFKLDFDAEGAQQYVRKGAINFIERAAIVVENRARELLSIAGTGRVAGKKKGPVERSKPGEPPRKQTGRLRASVTREIDEAAMEARVGTNVAYGKHLELGTKRGILPRPWLRRALAEMQSRVNDILAGTKE
jgi:phage gpG-like protein